MSVAMDDPWAMAKGVAARAGVRVVVRSHGMRTWDVLLLRRQGELVLMVADDLLPRQAADAALRAMLAVAPEAWRELPALRRRRR